MKVRRAVVSRDVIHKMVAQKVCEGKNHYRYGKIDNDLFDESNIKYNYLVY